MAPTRLATIIALLVIIGGLIIYDIFLAANKVDGDTISEITAHYAKRSVFLPIALGVLIGHFLWPSLWLAPGWLTLLVIGTFGSLTLGFDIYEAVRGGLANLTVQTIPLIRQYPIIIFSIGVFIGRFFWPQSLGT